MFPGFFHATAFVTMMLLRYSDDHPHVAMVNTAEVMADNGVHPRRLGRDGEFSGASGLDLLIDFQRTRKKAVRHILARQPQRNGLAILQRDLIGREAEAFGRDLDDSGWILGARGPRRDQTRHRQQGDTEL